MPLTEAVLVLPALSLTVALADRLLPCPLMVLSAGQCPSTPDRSSEQVQVTVTSPWYQPLPFGAVVAAPDSDGAVSSMLMPARLVDALLPAASVAVPLADWSLPSPRVTGWLHDFTPDRPIWSLQVKPTVTSALYQPLLFALR